MKAILLVFIFTLSAQAEQEFRNFCSEVKSSQFLSNQNAVLINFKTPVKTIKNQSILKFKVSSLDEKYKVQMAKRLPGSLICINTFSRQGKVVRQTVHLIQAHEVPHLIKTSSL